jgi:phosphoribosylglycinamide formyltransferase-1
MRICTPEHPLKLAVLISGNGSNLQALIDATADTLPAEICVVVSNQQDAYGLERAKRAQIPTEVLVSAAATDKNAYDRTLLQTLESYQPELIILAGFMRVLGTNFIEHFKNRIINIHPSLLPKYRGLHTHEQVLAAKDKAHGATVHAVTAELDNGPIIMQTSVSVSPDDDLHSLKNKVHTLEHKLYPEVVRLYAQGRLKLQDNLVFLDGEPLPREGLEFRVHY